MLHLKRFVANMESNRFEKCTDAVQFPTTLDFRKYCSVRVRIPRRCEHLPLQAVASASVRVVAGGAGPLDVPSNTRTWACLKCTLVNHQVRA